MAAAWGGNKIVEVFVKIGHKICRLQEAVGPTGLQFWQVPLCTNGKRAAAVLYQRSEMCVYCTLLISGMMLNLIICTIYVRLPVVICVRESAVNCWLSVQCCCCCCCCSYGAFFFYLQYINILTPNVNYSGRTAPLTSKVAFYIFIQQIWALNILNMLYTLRFFLFKMQFVS